MIKEIVVRDLLDQVNKTILWQLYVNHLTGTLKVKFNKKPLSIAIHNVIRTEIKFIYILSKIVQ